MTDAYLAMPKAKQSRNIFAVVTSCERLMRLGVESKHASERYCSFPVPDGWWEKKRASLRKRIQAVLDGLGSVNGFELGGDPRGFTLKLTLKTKRTNDFGGEGFGVPNS